MTSTSMIFRGLALTAALSALTTQAGAEVIYRGSYQITAVNAACKDGPNVGSIDNAQFHPRGQGNMNFTSLTTIWTYGGHSYKLDGANFTSSFQEVISDALGYSVFTTDKKSSILLDPVPAIEADTNALVLTGKIKNIWGNIGQEECIADFRAALYRRVD